MRHTINPACTRLVLFILNFVFVALPEVFSQPPSPYPQFDNWPIVRLRGEFVACRANYESVFRDNFKILPNTNWIHYDPSLSGNLSNSTQSVVEGSFHAGAPATIFTDRPENVNFDGEYLCLTVRREPEDQPYVLSMPDNTPFTADHGNPNYENITSLTRNVTSGMARLSPSASSTGFNLGNYHAICQFPDKGYVWNAFWMYHLDEIDIFDYGFKSKISQNIFKRQEWYSSVQDAPCCTKFVECDYCPTGSCDTCQNNPSCGACNPSAPPLSYDWGCNYLANGFHNYGCEWTPYAVRFYVDGVTTTTIYRYYDLNRNPINIECGGYLPDGFVKENPGFPTIKDQGFMPQFWVTVQDNQSADAPPCDANGCANNAGPDDLPATLKIDEFEVEEKPFEHIELRVVPECFELCLGKTYKVYLWDTKQNDTYKQNKDWNTPLAYFKELPQVVGFYATAHNMNSAKNSFDLTYYGDNGPDASVTIKATVVLGSREYDIEKTIKQPKPDVLSLKNLDGSDKRVCISKGLYCGSYTVKDNGVIQTLNQCENNGLKCDYCFDDECDHNIEVEYTICGNKYTINETIKRQSDPEGLISDNNSAPSNLVYTPGANYINNNTGSGIISFASSGWTIQSFSATPGVTAGLTSQNTEIQFNITGNQGTFTLTLERDGCIITRQVLIYVNAKRYEVFPNPTSGDFFVKSDLTSEVITLDNGDQIEIKARPEHLYLYNSNQSLLISEPLDENTSTAHFSIPSNEPSGVYKVAIKDKNSPGLIYFNLVKQ